MNIVILNDPLVVPSTSLKEQSCWFSNINVVSSRKEVVVCLALFFYQKSILLMRRAWQSEFSPSWKRCPTIFVQFPNTNTASVAGIAEKLWSFTPLHHEEVLKFESLSVSFSQGQLIIFHIPEAVGFVFGSISIAFKTEPHPLTFLLFLKQTLTL